MSAGLLPSLNTLPQAATEHTIPGRVSGRLQGRARPVSGSKGHQLASPLLSVQQAGWSSQISLAAPQRGHFQRVRSSLPNSVLWKQRRPTTLPG